MRGKKKLTRWAAGILAGVLLLTLLGYASQLRVNRAVTDSISDSAPSDQHQLTYSTSHCEAACSGETVFLEEPQLNYATERWLAGAMDKETS